MREFSHLLIVEPGRVWPSAHAASIAELASGEVYASWFAGTREGATDSAIWTARWPDGVWSAPARLVDTPGFSDGNSVLWLDGTGDLRIWYVTMEGWGWASCPVRERRSADAGRNWSADRYIRLQHGWMVRNEPIRWNRRLLMPMYDERDWRAFVLISDDGGETWTQSGPLGASVGIIQPALAPLGDGRLLMFLRSRGGAIYRSYSTDDTGLRWTAPEPTTLPNPDSAVDLIALDGGALLAVFNLTARGRSPLRVARSDDDGLSWNSWRDLETKPGEFSYPTVIQTSGGGIHVLYTWRRQTIAHACFDESWVRLARADES